MSLRIQYSMGSSGFKGKESSYYQRQLSLFRWRADSNTNTYLPRVRFTSRQQYLQKQRFGLLLDQQLQKHLFVDVEAIKHCGLSEEGQVLVFQQYWGRLAQLEGLLEPGECIYVLLALMGGYQRIIGRLSRTHIDLRFCFLTLQGEVRTWISDNPASNDLQIEITSSQEQQGEPQRIPVYSSEAGAVKRVVQQIKRLSGGSRQFQVFWEALRGFIKGNILHNCNFASARRFVNRYLFQHGINLPFTLAKALQRARIIRAETAPSEVPKRRMETQNATQGQLSTEAQLENLRLSEAPQNNSSSMPPEKVPSYEGGCRTPKTEQKFNPLDSTLVNSQILFSRGKDRKGHSFHKSRDQIEPERKEKIKAVKFSQTQPSFLKKAKAGNPTGKVSVKFHSRQPSLDQDSSSIHVSPQAQKSKFDVHHSYAPQPTSPPHVNPVQTQGCFKQSIISPPASQEKMRSQLLYRQVSGLVSNNELSIYESLGTLQSIDNNSRDSRYEGVLTQMGRTAKMLNFPTDKRLATFFRSNEPDQAQTQ